MVDIDELIGKVRGLKKGKKARPLAEHKLNYDAFAETLEPVYFWISTSPTDNSKDVLLKSEKSPQYSNPLYRTALQPPRFYLSTP